ncbi:MAG: hypothetical protein P8Y70_17495, partial [Candidatus Lokiarchaeota archaeon]
IEEQIAINRKFGIRIKVKKTKREKLTINIMEIIKCIIFLFNFRYFDEKRLPDIIINERFNVI